MTDPDLAQATRVLMDALAAQNVAAVEIPYDGEHDGAQMQDVNAMDAEGRSLCLHGTITLDLPEAGSPVTFPNLYEALEEFAWMVLRRYHDGFEINDGGFGTITFDVGARKVVVEHSERVLQYLETRTEV